MKLHLIQTIFFAHVPAYMKKERAAIAVETSQLQSQSFATIYMRHPTQRAIGTLLTSMTVTQCMQPIQQHNRTSVREFARRAAHVVSRLLPI